MILTITHQQADKSVAQWNEEREATATASYLDWFPTKDKYGRPVKQLDRIHTNDAGHWVKRDRDLAVVVTLPKQCTPRYLVNVRPKPGVLHGDVTYHHTLKAAKDHAMANLNR